MTRPSRFEGTIGRSLADSEPWFDEPPHPGASAPNVVVVLLDDTGFAQFGCYGSDIDTPNIDALAAEGLQFTNFHVTPLCSPTRASLLTGRSQHAVGMRALANFRTGFPHQLGHITDHAATVAEVLREPGLRDVLRRQVAPRPDGAVLGRRPVRPVAARPWLRPLLRIPGGRDRPVPPELVCDNHPIEPPRGAGGRLPPQRGPRRPAAADDRRQQGRAARPTVLRLPRRSAPRTRRTRRRRSTSRKYRGAFDEGWDVARQRWFERQLETRRDPGRYRRSLHATPASRRGTTLPDEPAAAGVPPAGGVRRVPRPHRRPDRSPRRRTPPPGRARQHRVRSCWPTTARRRRADRSG